MVRERNVARDCEQGSLTLHCDIASTATHPGVASTPSHGACSRNVPHCLHRWHPSSDDVG
jgi:hypothetical protein